MVDTNTSQAATSRPNAQRGSADFRSEYLAFRLGNEDYGIEIHCVQEIRSFEQPTHIATAPDFVLGVRNLRGVIVPVVDMRVRFGNLSPIYDAQTVTIVLSVGHSVIGMVVDSVSDVVGLTAEQIKPSPEFGGELATDYITGIGSIEQNDVVRMLILLNIEKLIHSTDAGLIRQAIH